MRRRRYKYFPKLQLLKDGNGQQIISIKLHKIQIIMVISIQINYQKILVINVVFQQLEEENLLENVFYYLQKIRKIIDFYFYLFFF